VRELTLVLPYYENPGMLREQQRQWRTYPAALAAALHVIVVDDGSPQAPALPHVEDVPLASFLLLRTGVDVRWNWLFCRNLGVAKATTEWVLLTDIDHVLPVETLRALVEGPLDPEVAYRFSRVDAPNLTPYKPHPNTWLMTRAMFDRTGGYDERLSGFYGTDGEYRDRVSAAAREVVLRDDVMVRYSRDVIADASTTTYGRKEPQDRDALRLLREERAKNAAWRPKRLTFTWSEQCRRP
jgi:hypothetical protein